LKTAPAISLVVCTIGRVAELERLFRSLREQVFRSFEVILVDQNPDDCINHFLAQFVPRFAVTHLKSEPGLSRARNVGMQQAKGKLVGFPDDDCWYAANTLKNIAEYFTREEHVHILLGRTIDENGIESVSPFRGSSGAVSKRNVWRSGNSNTLFVRYQTARQIGFDESLGAGAATPFKSGEETDFVLRALSRGKRAFFDRQLVVFHAQTDVRIGPAQLVRAQSYSTGFGHVLRKHHYGIGYLLFRVTRSMARCLTSAIMLDVGTAKYKWAWAVGTLGGYFHSETNHL
jgi:glycosyltransferase involved in cell wall biosynthesis